MSCSSSSYSPEKATWSSQSSLRMGNYYPYPELAKPLQSNLGKNLPTRDSYNLENYCAGGTCYYDPNTGKGTVAPSETYHHIEKFNTSQCAPSSYDTLNTTWSVQKPFQL